MSILPMFFLEMLIQGMGKMPMLRSSAPCVLCVLRFILLVGATFQSSTTIDNGFNGLIHSIIWLDLL